MMKPNLWITGLPKAGTSSLFSTLQSHAEITGTNPKETFFLLDHDSTLLNKKDNYWKDGEIAWSQFITPMHNEATRYIMEGTTHLFFQKDCLRVLQKHYADSKFVIMLRDPVERLYSSFLYTRDTLLRIPPEILFSQYVSDLLAKRSITYVKNPVSHYVLTRELEYSNYHSFLTRWYDSFNRECIFVGLFEDYVSSNALFMKNLFGFLQLDYTALQKKHSNRTVAYKHPSFHKAVRQAVKYLPVGGRLKGTLKEMYLRHFSAAKQLVSDEDHNAKNVLREYFRAANEKLRDDYSVDISKWT